MLISEQCGGRQVGLSQVLLDESADRQVRILLVPGWTTTMISGWKAGNAPTANTCRRLVSTRVQAAVLLTRSSAQRHCRASNRAVHPTELRPKVSSRKSDSYS